MNKNEVINEAGWNAIAFKYQEGLLGLRKTSEFYYGPFIPTEKKLKLLGNVKGKVVLELGCGAGENSIALLKKGAKKAIGIDISESQIEFGKKLAEYNQVKIEFIQGSIQTLPWIKSKSIDIVVSTYALQYIEDIGKCFNEVARVIKKDGLFVFSLDHPIWFSGKWTHGKFVWQTYWNKRIEWVWKRFNTRKKAIAFPKNIETLTNALTKNGFVIEKILEPKPIKEKNWHDYTFKKLSKVPATVIFTATKK